MAFWIILLVVALPLIYVRMVPLDPERWHKQAEGHTLGEKQLKGGYIWREAVTDDGQAKLAAYDGAAGVTLRTKRLAGSVEEGQTTYVTRSLLYGFPDYTTIGVYTAPDGQTYLEVFARLRFGNSDLGVNAKRVKVWRAIVEGG